VIARIRGSLLANDPMPIIEVGGLGLAVQVSGRTAAQLPPKGQQVTLVTYLHVREDHLSLYGFATIAERDLFLHLLSVSGIGPRVALTLLSSAPLEELERAIVDGDATYLTRLPGLGKKTAARLIIELQGKVKPSLETPDAARVERMPLFDEAVLALTSLGMLPRAARDALDKVDTAKLGAAPRVEDLVKAALKSGTTRA
jgi:Holliday junction DNA helicase RuvA